MSDNPSIRIYVNKTVKKITIKIKTTPTFNDCNDEITWKD